MEDDQDKKINVYDDKESLHRNPDTEFKDHLPVHATFICTRWYHFVPTYHQQTIKKLWTASYELQKKIHSTNYGKHLTSTSKCTTPDFLFMKVKRKGNIFTNIHSVNTCPSHWYKLHYTMSFFLLSSCIPFLLFHNKVNLRKRGGAFLSWHPSYSDKVQTEKWPTSEFKQKGDAFKIEFRLKSDSVQTAFSHSSDRTESEKWHNSDRKWHYSDTIHTEKLPNSLWKEAQFSLKVTQFRQNSHWRVTQFWLKGETKSDPKVTQSRWFPPPSPLSSLKNDTILTEFTLNARSHTSERNQTE